MAFPISKEAILVFNKDGVIFHSELVKLNVYEELFSDFPKYREEIHQYNRCSVGTPPKMKFMHICGNILKLSNTDDKVAHYMRLSGLYLNLKLK